MDSNVQRIFGVLVAVVILFLFPVYIAFEKKDDISYALALRITYNFVNNVKAKGYVSKEMYDDFVKELNSTSNYYDIKLEHIRKRYDPVIYSYNSDFSKIVKKFDYNLYSQLPVWDVVNASGSMIVDGVEYTNLLPSYIVHNEIYTEKQILPVLNTNEQSGDANKIPVFGRITKQQYASMSYSEVQAPPIYAKNVYTMNAGDEFSVRIVNKNTTIATILFNALTLGLNYGTSARIYINYGGTITNETYRTFLDDLRYQTSGSNIETEYDY